MTSFQKNHLILASASPRRHELLAKLGLQFEIAPSQIEEFTLPGEKAEDFVSRMAREKALDVSKRYPQSFVLGADTIVVHCDKILGKPKDRNDARQSLQLLSGDSHYVFTAVALVSAGDLLDVLLIRSTVAFRQLSSTEIEEYLDTDEPYDKAGSYGIQGRGSEFIAAVDGSRSNVMGLPMDEVMELLCHNLNADIVRS